MTINLHWAWMLAALSLAFACLVGRKIHPSVGALLAIILVSAAANESVEGLYGALILALVAGAFAMLDARHYQKVYDSVCILGAASIVVTIWQLQLPASLREGISSYPSMNGCTIALTFPLIINRIRHQEWWVIGSFIAYAVLSIFATMTSVPVGVLLVVLLAGQSRGNRKRDVAVVASVCGALLALGYFLDPINFLSSSGRFDCWRKIIAWWIASGKILFGLGSGASAVIFGQQAMAHHESWGLSLWAHNDYLQLLFDNGLMGLTAAIVVLVCALKRCWDRPSLFAAIMGYAAAAFFNMPVHLPIQACLGAALLWMAHCEQV